MIEIDHEAAKEWASLIAHIKSTNGNLSRAYLDSQRQLALRDQEITDQANKMQSEIGMLQLREKQLEKQLAAERARVEALCDVIHDANGIAYPFAEMQDKMTAIINAHAQGDKPMNARLIDHLRDNAGDALDLFRDITKDDMTEIDLIVGLLHHIDERGGDVEKSHATALGMYQAQKIKNALIELGGTKHG